MDNIDFCVDQALMGCVFDREAILEYARAPRTRKNRTDVWMSIKNGNIKQHTYGIGLLPDMAARWRQWRRWYQRLASKNSHWDLDLIIRCGDMPDTESPVPKLSICSFGVESQNVPVPTWNDRVGIVTAKRTKIRWHTKRKMINFIGAPRRSTLYRGRAHPRVEFCNWAVGYPKEIYAKLTNEGRGHRNWRIGKRGLKNKTRGPMSMRRQLEYRYLLNIDGNSTAWYRLPWQMASNSVCMNLVTDINQQIGEWYYPLLKKTDIPSPFIWVTQDNILDIKEDLDRDDGRCLEQIQHGNSFVKAYLSNKSKRYYTTRLFEEINSLMK